MQISGDSDGDRLARALTAAAAVAEWDADKLAEVNEVLSAAVPGDSPRIVMVGTYEESSTPTLDWLVRRHGLEITCFSVNTFRFGSERLLSVRREFPPREAGTGDAASAMQRMLESASAPPPKG